jgi:glycosyltransferase involved in cell wall biosynthesis
LFPGFQSNVKDMLAIMDVCVIPSLQEGFPMVTLEAMAMAKPIIATNIDGITEQISDGMEGLLVPHNDSVALAQAIKTVLDNSMLGRDMGQRARQTVENKFTVEKMIEETERVYHSLSQ